MLSPNDLHLDKIVPCNAIVYFRDLSQFKVFHINVSMRCTLVSDYLANKIHVIFLSFLGGYTALSFRRLF